MHLLEQVSNLTHVNYTIESEQKDITVDIKQYLNVHIYLFQETRNVKKSIRNKKFKHYPGHFS